MGADGAVRASTWAARTACARWSAGTTGAGKSELLQALVAVARRAPPARPAHVPARRLQGRRRVQGLRRAAAHRRARHRPRRAPGASARWISLNAELRRREALLHATRAPGPARARAPRDPDARAADPADRRRRVRDAGEGGARRSSTASSTSPSAGRSLGLHLVLATQRPRGVVNDTIRANTNLRIALRMTRRGGERGRHRRAGRGARSRAGCPGARSRSRPRTGGRA